MANEFRCSICGRFIAYADIGTDKIVQDFTPDSEFTTECLEMWHKDCDKSEREWGENA